MRARMDAFVTDEIVVVPVDIKPLDKSKHVWALRSKTPRPGMRLLGQFADKDCFVATELEMRMPLGDKSGFG